MDISTTNFTFQIVSQAKGAGNKELCAAGDDQSNMIVKARNQNDTRQQWIFLSVPTIVNPYGGFAFVLINLGYSQAKALYISSGEYPTLIDLSGVSVSNPSTLWRLQSEMALNCVRFNDKPLTIEGGDGWKEGSKLQLWSWNNQSNQHWSVQQVSKA